MNITERTARDQLPKTPVLDESKTCERCGRPFRCPIAQTERIICGPCR
jgi:hypothetical protein